MHSSSHGFKILRVSSIDSCIKNNRYSCLHNIPVPTGSRFRALSLVDLRTARRSSKFSTAVFDTAVYEVRQL
eukprot:SAG31_NODE_24650_length_477_cov_0.693122_1_plen_71_part_10